MKKLWLVLVVLLAASALIFTGCKSDDDEGGSSGGGPFDPVINNPTLTKFQGFGSAATFSGNINFTATTGNGYACAIYYKFPTEASGYANIKVTYTLTKLTSGDSSKPMKITIKDDNGSSSANIGAGTDGGYPESNTNTTKTYEHTVAAFTKGGIGFHHNVGAGKDESADYTINVTKIEFSN